MGLGKYRPPSPQREGEGKKVKDRIGINGKLGKSLTLSSSWGGQVIVSIRTGSKLEAAISVNKADLETQIDDLAPVPIEEEADHAGNVEAASQEVFDRQYPAKAAGR